MAPRAATRADYRRLWALDQACYPPEIAYGWEEMRTYLTRPGAIVLVLEGDDGIGAFVLAQPERHRGHIVTLDVQPSWRRRGWGRLLMQAAEAALRAAGKREVWLETAMNNAAALALYTGLGYRVLRVLRGYYPGGLDGLQMTKLLAPADAGP